MPMVRIEGKTHHGRKRPSNEDALWWDENRASCAVADGMGGAAAGEIASAFFVETAKNLITSDPSTSPPELVQEVFATANRRIQEHVRTHPSHQGMGCTAELLVVNRGHYTLGHVGDSRTYLLRNGRLSRLTRDHSLVQEQLDQGVISPREAQNHPLRHVILRAVGIEDQLALDLIRGPVEPGDLFLLCTDGLTDMVDDDTILTILGNSNPLIHKVEQLVDEANRAGGRDNITVVLLHVQP